MLQAAAKTDTGQAEIRQLIGITASRRKKSRSDVVKADTAISRSRTNSFWRSNANHRKPPAATE